MSSDFRRRMKKVLTPPLTSIVQVADGAAVPVVGMCTAQLTVAGHQVVVLFTVLATCPHDLILGLDFLAANSALIDCSAGVLRLELPQISDAPYQPACRLQCSDFIHLPSKTVTYVDFLCSPAVPDGDYYATPITDVLLAHNVAVPYTVLSITANRTCLPLVNFGFVDQVLPQGISVAHLCPLLDLQIEVLALDTLDSTPRTALSAHSGSRRIVDMIATDLPPPQVEALQRLLEAYQDIFDFGDRPLGQTSFVQHRIHTGDANPVHRRPYRVSASERSVIQKEVNKMLAKDIIEPSSSPWASPVVLVKKKDGSWRFCVDYRHLNNITKKDAYPLPRIDDALDCLHGAAYFSSIDLRSGYWQIAVDPMDREKTAFVTPDGLYQFKVMPFGLCNAPATFERMMDSLLHGFKWSTCLCYLDDVIVFAPTFEAHLERLSKILDVFRLAGLQLNSSKCRFGRRRITILGHIVDANGVQPDPEKVRAVKDFPVPKTAKDVRSFVGLCSYFRRFIKNFAEIARPLTDLLKQDATFNWGPSQAAAFTELATLLTPSPVLAHFDPTAPTEVRTDASGYGIGAVLAQRQRGQNRVIAYASRLLSPSERNYSITERECLALVWAVAKFRPYLYGRPFTVLTDHHALCWLASLKDPTGRLARWALRLQEYSYTVVYKSGRLHKDVDCLSRYPVADWDSTSTDSVDCVLSISQLLHLGDEQRRDPDISRLIQRLESSPYDVSVRMFTLKDHTLYRRNLSPAGHDLLPVIPKHLRSTVLRELHDAPTAGHLGVSRTYDRVRRRFYWPGLSRSVRRYVNACEICQRRKKPSGLPAGYLQPINIPSEPFFRVGLDLLGPFPTSASGNKWVAVATDYATRYAVTRAMPTSCATDVADFLLRDLILVHGAPRQLLTDRGRTFLSKVVDDILRSCSTQHKLTTSYHPQTNGLTERLNRTLTDMLSKYVSADHRDWDLALPYVTFAYNSSRHDTAGYSPFDLLFGREPTLPLDTFLPAAAQSTSEYARDAIARADHARQLAHSRLTASQDTQKHRYDKRHRDEQFPTGSLVLLWSPTRHAGLSEKLLSRFTGPYRVLRRVTDVTYEIVPDAPSTSSALLSRDVVHVSRLKRYHTPPAVAP
uniref:RNA-directed DNA polymerase n=1 Tax=Rhipicephalus pulchellus TaxID=72859 RepID=L7LYP4_RHIPC